MSGGDWKAMFKAIQDGDLNLVDYYLQVGINPDYQHPEYMASPLIESIRYNHLQITELLLEKGADPSIKEGFDGETPMAVAKKEKNQEAIQLLTRFIE